MLAYHSDPRIKSDILSQLERHRIADEIVQGKYWQGGKGCAVGCTIHGDDHMEYENRFGIPVVLARLEDRIFEGLVNGDAKAWPERFMSAIKPGADLSLVGWQFQWWLLTDPKVNPGIKNPLVKEAVKLCADALYPLTKGDPLDITDARSAGSAAESAAWSAESAAESARSAARSAAWSAWSAAESAAGSAGSAAGSAGSAAGSAGSAAESARSAARSAAWSARSAAESARSAARSAAWSAGSAAESAAWSAGSAARSARSAAESAAYKLMADKLVTLIREAE